MSIDIVDYAVFSGSAAAGEAGMYRRYGGIHFRPADLAGRKLGRLVADEVWSKAQEKFRSSPRD